MKSDEKTAIKKSRLLNQKTVPRKVFMTEIMKKIT